MNCKIADLIAEIPEAGGMAPRCKEYLWNEEDRADIIIRTELYNRSLYHGSISDDDLAYMETGRQFYSELLNYEGFYLHSSAVQLDGKAYLFSGTSGVGKSTHTRIWQSVFGANAKVFNDDKPCLRRMNGTWYAYGTPWCGKDGINQNVKVPLAGICFMKQAKENYIRELSNQEAVYKILPQTIYRLQNIEKLDVLLRLINMLIKEIPVFELENRPEPEAALLSYETMRRKAEEIGL